MLLDGGEHLGIGHGEAFASQLGAEPRVEQDRSGTLRFVDGKPASRTLGEEALRAVESRNVVEQPGQTRLAGICAVPQCEDLGAARDARRVGVAMLLTDLLAHPARNVVIGQALASRSAPSRLR